MELTTSEIIKHIRALIIAEIRESITPTEKLKLDLIRAAIPEAQSMSDYLHSVLTKEQLKKEELQRIKALVEARRIRRKIKRVKIVTAMACLTILALLWFYACK
ncbi:hypothetical protein [Chitinophaga tropicalis]|uniref:Uncharacterized protein n=1 Tax=Chitinophaga tropicalis TaxID=2683588 RepID=A0A7K1UAI6_9BACT|nr:hypothetical protein [Chitinophaga tropicalis]MVT11391.1 hypothetical protein [Chitinophaga tropicalis]